MSATTSAYGSQSFETKIETNIQDQTYEILRDLKVVPAVKAYSTTGTYWVAPNKPMPYYSALAWIKKEVFSQYNTDKSWVGSPEVKIVPSRGLLDYVPWVKKHPELPDTTIYE